MQMNEMSFDKALPVDGYGPGFFRVGGKAVSGPMCISGGRSRGWGGYDDVDTLLGLAGSVDVLFVGTGGETAHIPPALRATLEGAGLGVEVMNSPAACRTYNVLLSEGRRVALAVLPV
ncbi:Mth938-like domain-containing protein [Mesobacterium sp. TK19101]|uniref:Mth938-like domain-containing protein n=1 Tax=Mesobacterium hydrothermale TaxID=3111907 RepID=A0ABU6HJ10_9RHOB|nr:Mth938-like domain-containing protein [Mesobacterium sp. TK19101]MEC3861125.1 Mth938-like domain-containing protein [Mesobacterium sp. TK19101]